MTTLNVRLGPEEQRCADALREQGVAVSQVVRDAIRAEYARRVGARPRKTKPSRVVEALLAAHPAPTGDDARAQPDPRDRHAVRDHIAARLRARRR